MKKRICAGLVLLMVPIFGCSSAPTKNTCACAPTNGATNYKAPPSVASSIEVKQVAAEELASYVTELSFQKGQSTLTEAGKARLHKIFASATEKGTIREVKSLSWSDEEYPSRLKRKLAEGEKRLADQRNQAIKAYFEERSQGLGEKVQVYNMAERPGAVAKFFNTSNSNIKKEVKDAGIADTETANQKPRMAARAIVMILMKE